jgi:cytochrome c oxidase cbb3-type subunit 2
MNRRSLLPLAIGVGMILLPAASPAPAAQEREAQVRAALEAGADPVAATYRLACADCHGVRGDGRGLSARGFAQPATDFTKGTYKFRTTTTDAVPAPGDIERSIREGMSGTEMVPFKNLLTEKRIAELAAYLRGFSEDLSDPDTKPEPDEIVAIPAERPFPRTAETVEEGKELWDDNDCADCHEENGRGTSEEQDDWGRPVFMVSFLEGYYKSGTHDSDLYRSIAAGMAGTTMPAFNEDMSEEEIWKVVDYIRSLGEEQSPGPLGVFRWPLVGRLARYFLGAKPSGFDYSNY